MVIMKTTVKIRDDLFRKAKARAALLGETFGSFLEDALARALVERDTNGDSLDQWAESLPRISKAAGKDLQSALDDPDFRQVESQMWK